MMRLRYFGDKELPMDWNKFREEYGEGPEEHFDNPADYQDSIGNKFFANRIRKKREESLFTVDFPEDGN